MGFEPSPSRQVSIYNESDTLTSAPSRPRNQDDIGYTSIKVNKPLHHRRLKDFITSTFSMSLKPVCITINRRLDCQINNIATFKAGWERTNTSTLLGQG